MADSPQTSPATPMPCSKGCQQSPVLIDPKITSATPLDLRFYSAPANATVPATGNKTRSTDADTVLTFKRDAKNYIVLEGVTYYEDNWHLHKPGEHTFLDDKGKAFAYDAEMHLVYKTKDGKAAAVFGVQFAIVGPKASKRSIAPDAAWTVQAEALGKAFASKSAGKVSLNARDWVPTNAPIVRYEGSLTTDTFDEIVSWIVYTHPFVISKALFDTVFRDLHHARETQNLNRRFQVGYNSITPTPPATK